MTVLTVANAAIWLAEKDAEFDPTTASPGPLAFVVVAVLAVAIILLGFNLVSRLRRSRYRSEVREQIAEEQAAGQAGAADIAGQDPDAAANPDSEPRG